MGRCHKLFYSTADNEQTLDRRISPSEPQSASQKEYWNSLRDHLIQDLRKTSGHSISSWLQGSYKFGTQIRPANSGDEFDIDLGVYFEWEGSPEDGQHSPKDLKTIVQESLQDYCDDPSTDANDVSKPKTRCQRIHYSEDFHIDVPSYHLAREKDERHLATENDEWEASDPKAIYVWWKKAFPESTRVRARRLVKYIKMWAALNITDEDRPSSILLTVLAANAILKIDTSELSGDDEWLEKVVEEISERLEEDTTVLNPVDRNEDLNRLSKEATKKLVGAFDKFKSICSRAISASSFESAAEIWTEAFEHFFPAPDEETILEETASKGALAVLQHIPEVAITATHKNNPSYKKFGTNSIGPIAKNCDIKFAITNLYALPRGCTIHWIVRNEGPEAEQQNDLGHVSQEGPNASESSAYTGTHYMDVSVKLKGETIGRRRIPVKITSTPVAERIGKRRRPIINRR